VRGLFLAGIACMRGKGMIECLAIDILRMVRQMLSNRRREIGIRRIGHQEQAIMIRKLSSGKYRLYSRKINPKTGRRRNLGTFSSRAAAEKHERAVQYFKRH
jgi:hypothetical protein